MRKAVATTSAVLRQIMEDSCSVKGKKELRLVNEVGDGIAVKSGYWVLMEVR